MKFVEWAKSSRGHYTSQRNTRMWECYWIGLRIQSNRDFSVGVVIKFSNLYNCVHKLYWLFKADPVLRVNHLYSAVRSQLLRDSWTLSERRNVWKYCTWPVPVHVSWRILWTELRSGRQSLCHSPLRERRNVSGERRTVSLHVCARVDRSHLSHQ